MLYRREIDGLRALAVLPVILYHGGFAAFPGGFVGVDVFFVISGYLITSIIAAELATGTFTLKGFYERRARRILPALFLVLFVCIPLAWLWLMPAEFRRFAHSLVAVVLLVSNFYFAGEPTSYFDTFTEMQPLLHTWSLAVEEHYYLLFPLFLMLAWKWGRRSIVILIGLAALASLALAHWMTPRFPSASFYLLPTRGWEIAAGALVALVLPARATRTLGHEAGALAGLALIGYAVFAFDASTPFPSLYTLVPVLGTVLVVAFASDRTLVGRLLGTPALVGVGLVSYSAYLWHQPLFAFARHRSLAEPSEGLLLALAALSLVLAYFTWRFVELPFRRKSTFSRQQIVKYSSWAAVTAVEIGIVIIMFHGFPDRLPAEAKATLATIAERQKRNLDGCNSDGGESKLLGCVKGAKGVTPTVALIGDSHADALSHDLAAAFAHAGLSFVQMTKNGCPVAVGFRRDGPGGEACDRFQANYLAQLAQGGPQTVVLVVRWPNYVWGNREYDNGEGGVSVGIRDAVTAGGVAPHESLAVRQEALLTAYAASVERLLAMGKRVVLVYPIPEQGWNIATAYAKGLWFGARPREPFAVRTASYRERNAGVLRALDGLGDAATLVRVRPEAILCDTFVKGRCASELNGGLLYFDDNHLLDEGARLLVAEIMRAVTGTAPATALVSN